MEDTRRVWQDGWHKVSKTGQEDSRMEKPADIQGGWIVPQRVRQDGKVGEDASCMGRLAESKAEEELKLRVKQVG